MKHAYLSVVLPTATVPDPGVLEQIDGALTSQARAHEIVIVTPYGQSGLAQGDLTIQGPITIVTTRLRSTSDGANIAGLARAVGDFVLEWHGPLDALDAGLIGSMLEPTDSGIELVEATGFGSLISRLFNRVVNRLRPRSAPLRKSVGRLYSRRAVQFVLGAAAFESQLDVLVAELPVQRLQVPVRHENPHHESFTQRLTDGFSLLSKGTRFGSAVPLSLAALSALFGVAAAVYALGTLVLRGETPEGWTTLMVVTALGQAVILTMLGLVWTRIDALARGLSRSADSTADVQILAPCLKHEEGSMLTHE